MATGICVFHMAENRDLGGGCLPANMTIVRVIKKTGKNMNLQRVKSHMICLYRISSVLENPICSNCCSTNWLHPLAHQVAIKLCNHNYLMKGTLRHFAAWIQPSWRCYQFLQNKLKSSKIIGNCQQKHLENMIPYTKSKLEAAKSWFLREISSNDQLQPCLMCFKFSMSLELCN